MASKHTRYDRTEKGRARHARYEDAHRAERRRAKTSWESAHRHKARGCRVLDGAVTLERVWERDQGVCALCGLDVTRVGDRTVTVAARPSIDHPVPVSRGGNHTWDNVRLAHVGCNARRGAPPTDEERDAVEVAVPDVVLDGVPF